MVQQFVSGPLSTSDSPRRGRPPKAVISKNLAELKKLVQEDPKITNRQIADWLKIGTSAVGTILRDLVLRKKGDRWVAMQRNAMMEGQSGEDPGAPTTSIESISGTRYPCKYCKKTYRNKFPANHHMKRNCWEASAHQGDWDKKPRYHRVTKSKKARIIEAANIKVEVIDISDESQTVELEENCSVLDSNQTKIEFIDTDALYEISETIDKVKQNEIEKKKKVIKNKRKAAKENPNKVVEAKNLTPRFTKIASKFNLHNLLLMFCQKCNVTMKKIYGLKQINCPRCEESLQYQCIKCTKRYRNYCDITMHLKYDCDKPKRFSCNACDYKTTRKYRLDDHCKSVHTFYSLKDLLNCAQCGKTFKLLKYLKWHQSHECGNEPHLQCPYCDFITKYTNSLRKHVKNIHNRDENAAFDCQKCGKEYKTRGALLNHVRNHCGKEPGMKCDHCNYRAFQKYPLLANHIQRNHPQLFPDKEFFCKHCDTNYHNYYGLTRHFKEAPICARKESGNKN